MTPDEEIALFRHTNILEQQALALVLANTDLEIPRQTTSTKGPVREALRDSIRRNPHLPHCKTARGLLQEADALYWEVISLWELLIFRSTSIFQDGAEDAAQEARFGMYRACLRFDPERGFRFSTYAMRWMTQTITRSRRTLLDMPSAKRVAQKQLVNAQEYLTPRLGREASRGDAAVWLGMSPKALLQAEGALACKPMSLDTPTEEGNSNWSQSIPGPGPTPEDLSHRSSQTRLLQTLMADLTEREKHILYETYLNPEPKNYREIGEVLGLSRERVRQIAGAAMSKIRHTAQQLPFDKELLARLRAMR